MQNGGADTPKLDLDAFTQWLQSFDIALTPERAAYVFRRLDMNSDTEVDVSEYVRLQLDTSEELLCHSATDASVTSTAFPGCPCNPVQGSVVAKCPAGESLP